MDDVGPKCDGEEESRGGRKEDCRSGGRRRKMREMSVAGYSSLVSMKLSEKDDVRAPSHVCLLIRPNLITRKRNKKGSQILFIKTTKTTKKTKPK